MILASVAGLPRPRSVRVPVLDDGAGGDGAGFGEEAEDEVGRAHLVVAGGPGLLVGGRHHVLGPGGEASEALGGVELGR